MILMLSTYIKKHFFLFFLAIFISNSLYAENINSAKQHNINFMECIWVIPDHFELVKETPMEFTSLDFSSKGSIAFKDKKFDVSILSSSRVMNLKVFNINNYDIYRYEYQIDAESIDDSATNISVVASDSAYIMMLDLTDYDTNSFSKNCLGNILDQGDFSSEKGGAEK